MGILQQVCHNGTKQRKSLGKRGRGYTAYFGRVGLRKAHLLIGAGFLSIQESSSLALELLLHEISEVTLVS